MFRRYQVLFAPDGAGSGGDSGSSGATSGSPTPPSAPSGDSGSPSSSIPSGASPSGGSPTPSSSPSAAPEGGSAPSPSETPSGDGLSDFGDILQLDDLDSVTAEPTPSEPAAPAAQPQEASMAPAPGTPQQQAPTAQATPPQGQQEQSPPPSPAEPGKLAELMKQNMPALVEQLASDFALSKEDAEALETDAIATVPKLLAKVYLRSQINMFQQLQKAVPAMVSAQVKTMRQNMDNENKFWSSWPNLDRVKHAPVLAKYAPLYRQANPTASLEQMVKDLGPIVSQAAGVLVSAGPNGASPSPQVRIPQSPFKPAMGGPAAIPSNEPEDPWAGLAQAQNDED